MKKIQSLALISIGALITSCSAADMVPTAEAKSKTVNHFAENGFGNAVAIVQHPAGIHRDGITYVSYQGALEDPYIAAYNHATKEWTGPFKAGVSAMGKDPKRKKKIDNHGKPSMIIDNEGYIHLFFGGHGGVPEIHGDNPLGNHHYGENKHVVSKKPYDVSEWEELKTIPPFGTYNQVIKMENGDIYLFYRHGAHRSDWVYHVSTDNGRSFGDPVSFLKHKRRDDVKGVDSWYPWVGRGQGDEIIVSFDYHLCWDGNARERGHTANREDLYYMTFNTKTKEWHNVEDERLPMPLTREVADAKAKVTDTGELWTFNGAAALDPEGNPHILMNAGKDVGQITGGPKQVKYIRWNGEAWTGGNTVSPVGARADLEVKSLTDVSLYMSYKDKNGEAVLIRRDSTDAGANFDNNKQLFRHGKGSFAISALIENAHPDAKMIITPRTSGTALKNMYLIGDNGPVQRKASDMK
ncbi:BNR-4 repeat-containing protein [Fretibacter rubidus]|uniref:BNR-4 repeat-containing protein n=1 Tax=Fretibacter rubidus TaxID=570162 RepID=UPI00352A36B7